MYLSYRMAMSKNGFDYDPETSVGYQLRKTFRRMEALLRKEIEPAGVSISVWYYLRVLWRQDGIKQRELAELVGLMQPTTVNALQNMRDAGLVRMEADRTDARAVRIHLTDKGRRLKQILLPRVAQINQIALRGIAKRDYETFMSTLRTIQLNTQR